MATETQRKQTVKRIMAAVGELNAALIEAVDVELDIDVGSYDCWADFVDIVKYSTNTTTGDIEDSAYDWMTIDVISYPPPTQNKKFYTIQ